MLWMMRPYLMTEDFATTACLINLRIVKASKLIESHLTVCVQDQDRKK